MSQVKFESLLDAKDEKEKLDCLRALLTEVVGKRLKVSDGIGTLLDVLTRETSPSVCYMIWMLFTRGSADDRLRELGRRTLENPEAPARGKAAGYLIQFHPGDREWLAGRFRGDSDPEVIFNVGRAVVSRDPHAAVDLWITCLDQTDSLPFWETVSQYVIAHGDASHREAIHKRDAAMGGGSTWQPIAAGIYAAHQVEYLDRPSGPVDYSQPVSWIGCDGCNRSLGVRQGREGERIRCRYCGHIFQLHLDPVFTK